ncbi:phage tail tube protein [Variovorax boronicumulans]|uniref:phage tail tube protein n=1 Tax=Variovorax boronicumulans TaxID=436515 RepID=UPI001C58AF2F
MSLITQIYKPMSNVGKVYARPYGVAAPMAEIGNVLQLALTHEEVVRKQEDWQHQGGGTHAQVRRVSGVSIALTMADLNLVNFARATYGTASESEAGTVTDAPHKAFKGGLIRLAHLDVSAVTVKKASATIPAQANYEVRPEGIYVLPGTTLTDADDLLISYTHGITGTIEALTTSPPELELSFGGLNEADSGKPVVVDIFKVGQGIAKNLALMSGNFMGLEVEGEVLSDPTKSGIGLSRFYRVQFT